MLTRTMVRRDVIVNWSTGVVSTVGGRWARFSQRCATAAVEGERERERKRKRAREGARNSTT